MANPEREANINPSVDLRSTDGSPPTEERARLDPREIHELRMELELGALLHPDSPIEDSSMIFAGTLEARIGELLTDYDTPEASALRQLSLLHAILADYYADPDAAIRAYHQDQRTPKPQNDVDSDGTSNP